MAYNAIYGMRSSCEAVKLGAVSTLEPAHSATVQMRLAARWLPKTSKNSLPTLQVNVCVSGIVAKL